MSYDAIRLETTSGDHIAWFAPNFEVVPQDSNDIYESPRGGERESVTRDNGLWTSELTVQGEFVHSDAAPPAFQTALQNEFGQQTVTPLDQINKLRAETVYADPGPRHFYHRSNEYTATQTADVDIANGDYPAVTVAELRTPEEGETSTDRAAFLVRLNVGVSR